jgi:Ammonia permease
MKFDDPLDAFGCHGVSGIIGSLLVGAFATNKVNSAVTDNGLFYGGGAKLLGIQLLGTVISILFTSVVVAIIIVVLKKFMAMRVSQEDETAGLDLSLHGEKADYLIDSHFRDVSDYQEEFRGQLSRFNKKS